MAGMKIRVISRLVGLFAFVMTGAVATAQDDPFKALLAARSLKCDIGAGSVGRWSGANVVIEKDNFGSALHFDSIDLRAGKARLIGNQGASDLTVWATASGVTFVEQTGFGNLVIITVFSARIPGKMEFYAVMSRHVLMLMNPPRPSQYLGTCRVWQ